ncbi:MAG: phospho-N-acetylmuramoyl-pentapeptide-transferase [Peptococcaceae bacterium]|jgi:phospho-N-acetylmuramoyl-pentapeptide-transferase|nr:phospho-N-acetylmuramoyl-pentapeptide-transferase [Peptococcaceae bacterium]
MWQLAVAFAISLGTCLIIGPVLIPALRRLKFGQSVRSDGPQSHLQKQGTPTMGGVMFFFSMILGTVFLAGSSSVAWFMLVCALGFGFIGFIDDYIKIVKKRSLGLTAKQKLLAQLVFSIVLAFAADYIGISTAVTIPLLGWNVELAVGYAFFVVFLLVGTTNAVNLTDGLDGLASGVTLIVALGYVLIGYMSGNMSVMVFAAVLMGSCLGFLVFNHHPAKVFMGDTGSLALGGAVAALAIVTKTELLLPLIGIIYVAETMSDIIQVSVYKKKKVRVFKMAPLHHHFELCGWSEWKVVRVFWAVTAAAVLLTLLCYNITLMNL